MFKVQEIIDIRFQVTEEGRCFVARIMHGGMIHRQGRLGLKQLLKKNQQFNEFSDTARRGWNPRNQWNLRDKSIRRIVTADATRCSWTGKHIIRQRSQNHGFSGDVQNRPVLSICTSCLWNIRASTIRLRSGTGWSESVPTSWRSFQDWRHSAGW